jgi:transposase
MQCSTYLHCQLARIRCQIHGAKTVDAPWAGEKSCFTLMFEAFAIRVLTIARSVEAARKLLGMKWHQVEAIKTRAVERGLKRRKAVNIPYVGIDEKQFRSGHRYISLLVDLQGGRVLDVVEERTEVACKALISKALTLRQQSQVAAVAPDMWKAYANAVAEKMPQADIVHDRFHISQHLNEAVDKARRKESRQLAEVVDKRLTGSKFQWLANQKNLPERYSDSFEVLRNSELKVARAWAIK